MILTDTQLSNNPIMFHPRLCNPGSLRQMRTKEEDLLTYLHKIILCTETFLVFKPLITMVHRKLTPIDFTLLACCDCCLGSIYGSNLIFVHDGIENSVEDFNSSWVGVVCPSTILNMGLFPNALS